MKRTEIERRERELRRTQKREAIAAKRGGPGGSDMSVGDYINQLHEQFVFDEQKIWNVSEDEVLETVMAAEADFPEKVEAILKKAIKKTKVKDRDSAFTELSSVLSN